MPFPPELVLVVACCRWPPSSARDAAVRDAAAARIDWELFPRVVARHRVEGLVHDGLRRAGVQAAPAVADRLAATASGIVRENLRFAAASGRLTKVLDAASVPHLFVKGVTLNMLAYGSLGLKRAWDIDLAVDIADYEPACTALERAGFRPVSPGPDATPEQRRAWVARRKHSEWTDPTGVAVELHASLTDNPLMAPGLAIGVGAREVAVAPGLALPTLPPDPLFAYLCVHGATHAWSRLKWIADVAAMIAGADDAEVERLHRAAAALGAGRSSGQALLLIARVFDRPLPPALDRELRRDPLLRALVRAALGSMTRGGPATELDRLVLGTVPIHVSHFFLARGWRYKWSEAARKLGGGGSVAANLSAWLARRANASKKVTSSAP